MSMRENVAVYSFLLEVPDAVDFDSMSFEAGQLNMSLALI